MTRHRCCALCGVADVCAHWKLEQSAWTKKHPSSFCARVLFSSTLCTHAHVACVPRSVPRGREAWRSSKMLPRLLSAAALGVALLSPSAGAAAPDAVCVSKPSLAPFARRGKPPGAESLSFCHKCEHGGV